MTWRKDRDLTRRERQILRVVASEPQNVEHRNSTGHNGHGYTILLPSAERTRGTCEELERLGLIHREPERPGYGDVLVITDEGRRRIDWPHPTYAHPPAGQQ